MTDARPMPMLRGERVWLRPLEKADVVEAVMDDAELAHYAGFKVPFAPESQERWFSKQLEQTGETTFQFVVCPLGSRERIGGCGLRSIDRVNGDAELSIFMFRGSWGMGLGTDAVNALLDFGFGELRLERIYLQVFDYNPRAMRSYQKSGFVQEAVLRRARFHRGAHHDVILMAILRHEWDALPRKRAWEYGQ
ncbi:MAG TPA: GNAT family protein [Candidatus Limnocylindria bacterium]|nr:GNAT family protein [Candidatus Limnocylindria bacterium]